MTKHSSEAGSASKCVVAIDVELTSVALAHVDTLGRSRGMSRSEVLNAMVMRHLRAQKTRAIPTEEERFWSNIDKSGGPDACWPWMGQKGRGGYGKFRVGSDRKLVPSHRYALIVAGSGIPDGMFALHSCDNPPCCNPSHLRAGTTADNARDRTERGRRHDTAGEKSPSARLTNEDVREIRARHSAGETLGALGVAFGMTSSNIQFIVTRRTWKHVA